jgi:FkbM family methyltransferase
MKTTIKNKIKLVFNYFGLELGRLPKEPIIEDYNPHKDAFLDQKKLLSNKQVKIIFDVGANIGQTAEQYFHLFKTSRIYCFEPFEESFNKLSNAYREIKSIKPYRLAISDKTENKTFYLNKANYTNSLLPIAKECSKYVNAELTDNAGCIDVDTITLDEFCKREQIDEIQILKMDIQGGELMALQGAKHILSSHSIDLIYTEVQFAKIYKDQANFYNLCEFLEQYGYVMYGLYDLNYGENGVLAWGDAIFISQEIEASLGK